MTLPSVCIVMYTYDRMECAEQTLRAALDNISYSGTLNVHIADDGSPDAYREALREVAGGYGHIGTIGVTNSARHGYGASYNRSSQAVHSGNEIIIPLEDDWLLMRPLDIDPLVRTLAEPIHRPKAKAKEIRCIRLGYIGFTQRLWGEVLQTPGGPMILLDPGSNEPHVFAGHARIETREFQRDVGPWPEGLAAGKTEFEVAHRPEARVGVAWPLDYGPSTPGPASLFAHIGARDLGELVPDG